MVEDMRSEKEAESGDLISESSLPVLVSELRLKLSKTYPRRRTPLMYIGRFLPFVGVRKKARHGPAIELERKPNQEEKYRKAKKKLIAELTELAQDIGADRQVPDEWRAHTARQIGETIGLLRACHHQALWVAAFEFADITGGSGEEWWPRSWTSDWQVLQILLPLTSIKAEWDALKQEYGVDLALEVEYRADANAIVVVLGDQEVASWPVHSAKSEDARSLAQELEKMIKECIYPEAETAERIASLERPS